MIKASKTITSGASIRLIIIKITHSLWRMNSLISKVDALEETGKLSSLLLLLFLDIWFSGNTKYNLDEGWNFGSISVFLGNLVFGKIISWAKYFRKIRTRNEVTKKPPKFLDALENNYIFLRKLQYEKKIQIANSPKFTALSQTLKGKYEKERAVREKISKSYANFIQGIPFYAVEVFFLNKAMVYFILHIKFNEKYKKMFGLEVEQIIAYKEIN